MSTNLSEILNAFIAHIGNEYKELSPNDIDSLRKYSNILIKLNPLFQKNKNLYKYLMDMLEYAASNLEAEQTQVKLYDEFSVSYYGEVKGTGKFKLKFAQKDEKENARIGKEKGVFSSRNVSLLIGDAFQNDIKKLLVKLLIKKNKVQSVKPYTVTGRKVKGRRVDDWLIKLQSGEEIPVEVKCSKDYKYFHNAYEQVKNSISDYKSVMLAGLDYSRKKIVIALFMKKIKLLEFKSILNSVFE